MRGAADWISPMWSNTSNYVHVTVVWNTGTGKTSLGGMRIIRKWAGVCRAHYTSKGIRGGGDSDPSSSEAA